MIAPNQPAIEPAEFPTLNEPEPHSARSKSVLGAHPEIRGFMGRNPYGLLVIIPVVAVQIACAAFVTHQPWWVILLLSITVGAFANNALWMMIHECSHNLMFKRSAWNSWAGILANLPQVLPGSVAFQRYHLQHHMCQGLYHLDADIPRYWEARMVGNSTILKSVWLLLLPLILVVRPLGIQRVRLFDRWFLANAVVQVAFDILMYRLFGPSSLVYFGLSFLFSLGLHPLGGRWIQEHYLFAPPQDTYSYYGLLNGVAFNIGYHNEHHDFPSVPWNKLPYVRSAVPEVYDSLTWHSSWSKLVFRFLTDRRISLFSRMVRTVQSRASLIAGVANADRQ
jgi:sphingolipid delta-4 desaturase